jgi:hypothetical protein
VNRTPIHGEYASEYDYETEMDLFKESFNLNSYWDSGYKQ